MMVILRWVSQLPQSSVHVIPRVFDGGQIQLVKDLAGHWSVSDASATATHAAELARSKATPFVFSSQIQ